MLVYLQINSNAFDNFSNLVACRPSILNYIKRIAKIRIQSNNVVTEV